MLLLITLQVQINPGPLLIILFIKQDQLPILVNNKGVFIFDIAADTSAEIIIVYVYFEVVGDFPLVGGEVGLVLLVGYAELLRFNEEDHAATHEVHHYVLELRDPVVFIDIIELNVLVLDDLKRMSGLIARD
jgi:hypothetical protein